MQTKCMENGVGRAENGTEWQQNPFHKTRYGGGKEENRFYLKNNAELPEYLK